VGVAHHHVTDGAPAIDEHPDLPVNFRAEFAEFAGEFLGDQAIRRDPPPRKLRRRADLAGLEAAGVAVDRNRRLRVVQAMSRMGASPVRRASRSRAPVTRYTPSGTLTVG
jgi:hypothetical protein